MKSSKIFTALFLLISGSHIYSQFKLPPYEKAVLENGLTIYLMELKEVPLISLNAVFTAGSASDVEVSGIASFTAEALKFGTGSYTKSEIDSLFNFYGSSLNIYTKPDYSGMHARFMKSDLDYLLPLIKEVIVDPVFPEDEIEKRKGRWIAELDQAKESPRGVIRNYFNKFLFEDSPYGNPVDGTKAGISSLNKNLVENFYRKNYSPLSSAIAIAGDFDAADMKNKLEKTFNEWKKTGNPPGNRFEEKINKILQPRVYLINKDNATETTFMVGGHGVDINNSDLTGINVVNTILGGRFTSWLNEELRTNTGLTYGAGSRFTSYKFSGSFSFSTFTAAENTERAIDLALKTYNRLFENGVDQQTLTSAGNYIKGQFPPEYETAGSLAEFLTQMYIYGLTDSYINDFEKNVDGLSTGKAAEIISKYFPKDNLQFVLIGKADEIRDIAGKYGTVIERNIDEDGF